MMNHINIVNDVANNMIEYAVILGLLIVLPFLLFGAAGMVRWICSKVQQLHYRVKRFFQSNFFLFLDDRWYQSEYNIFSPEYPRARNAKADHNDATQKRKSMETKSAATKHICPGCGFKLTSDIQICAEVADSASVVGFKRDCPGCKGHLDIVSIECFLKT